MKFKVTHKNVTGHLLFEYNSKGVLTAFENHSSLNDIQVNALTQFFPMTARTFEVFVTKSNSNKLLIPEDLSFEKFWNLYAYKVGKLPRVRKLWSELSDIDKADVLMSIPRYNAWLRGRSIERVYPETYLNQERWKNQY